MAHVTCSDSGFIAASALLGTPPYTFAWNTNPTTSGTMLWTDSAGLFQVSVTDSVGCLNAASVLVHSPTSDSLFDVTPLLISNPYIAGQPTQVRVEVVNLGCAPADGQAMLILDSLTFFLNSVPPPDQVMGDTLAWNYDSLAYQSDHFNAKVSLLVSQFTTIFDTICQTVVALPYAGDIDTLNNEKTYCEPALAAYDPNDKKAFPAGICEPHYALIDERIEYTIRFQNTGTAPANNVLLIDTIDSGLDIASLTVLSQSHDPMVVEVLPGNIVQFQQVRQSHTPRSRCWNCFGHGSR